MNTKNTKTAAEIVASLKRHEINDATITTTASASLRWSNYGVPDVVEEFQRGEVLALQDWRPEGVMIRSEGHAEVFASWRDLERLTAEEPKKTNTGAATVAAGKSKIIDNWTALDSAVVEQMGGTAQHDEDARRVTVSEHEAEELESVARCSCGAGGGFGGFIYYYETWEFFRRNRSAIVAALQEMAESAGEGCAVDLVRGFNCFKDDKPSVDEVGRILWGEIPAEWSEGSDIDEAGIANACAWFALEECANKWTEGEEVDDEGRAE